MLDFATLGLRVDNSQVKESKTALDQLGAAGEAAGAKVKQAFTPGTGAAALQRDLARTIAAMKDLKANYLNASVGEREFLDGMQQLQRQADATRAAIAKIPEPVQQVATATNTAGVGLKALRSPLATLASQSLGTSGSLGQLGSVLLSFSTGTGITLGVLAGLAALAKAVEFFGQQTRQTQKDYDDFLDSLRKKTPLAVVGAQLDVVNASLTDLARLKVTDPQKFIEFGGDNRMKELAIQAQQLSASYQDLLANFADQRAATAAEFADRNAKAFNALFGELGNADKALQSLTRTYDVWLKKQQQPTQLLTISSALGRTPSQANVPNVDLADANRLADQLFRTTVKLLPPVKTAAESWADGADAIEQGLRSAISLGEAFGGMTAETANLLTNLVNVAATLAQAEESALKAGKAFSLNAGDIVSLASSGIGILGSLFGGPSEADRERIRVEQENTRAVERNTAAKEFGTSLTGNQFSAAQAATKALLDAINQGQRFRREGAEAILAAAGLEDLQTLREQAKQLGIQIDTSSTQAFIDSLKALDAQLKQNALLKFTDTFTGALQALNVQLQATGADPLARLRATVELLSKAGAVGFKGVDSAGRPVNIPDIPALGSPALAGAFQGLDLGTSGGLQQAEANLLALITALQNKTLDQSQLGGLLPQEFLDQLGGLIDLIHQAEDAARARERNLQDLEVRRLRATSQGPAADALAFQLQQQREYEDAVRNGADALTLSTLKEVQRAEALQFANRGLDEAITGLKQFRDSLLLDKGLTTLSPTQQLAEAQRRYQELLLKAQAGDQAAAAQVPEVARQFLEASRAVNASGPQFASDFARVLADSDALARMFDGQKAINQLIYETGRDTATNTGNIVTELQTSNAALAAGFTMLNDKLEDLADRMEASSSKVEQLLEGKTL